MIASKRVRLTFAGDAVKEPLIYNMGHEFRIVTNIRMADVEHDFGWVILEIDGEADEIERSLRWAEERGVRVDPLPGDIVEG